MVYGRPSKAFSCSYAAWLKPNALAKTGETDSCSPSLCLKAISGSRSLGELFKARSRGWGRPRSGRNVPSGHQATNAAVSFIKTRSFRMTKAHTLSWELEVTQCWKAQDSHSCSPVERVYCAVLAGGANIYCVCFMQIFFRECQTRFLEFITQHPESLMWVLFSMFVAFIRMKQKGIFNNGWFSH